MLRFPSLATGWIAWTLALSPPHAALPCAQQRDDAWHQRVRAVLARDAGEFELEAVAERLARLGPEAMPTLLALLESAQGEGATPLLTVSERRALRLAFGHLRLRDVSRYVRQIAEGGSESARIQAFLVLGEISSAKEIDLFLALARTEAEPADDELDRALGLGLEGLLRREPQGAWGVVGRLFEFPPACRSSVIEALGRTVTPELPQILMEPLGRETELDPLLLHELGRACKAWRESVDGRVLAAIRPYLSSREVVLLIEAVTLVGELDDVESVPFLIELLEHSDDFVQASALRALQRVSGQQLSPDPRVWREWRRRETLRWLRESEGWLNVLGNGRPAQVVITLRSLAESPLFRRQASAAIVQLLERPEVDLCTLACATLARLRAREAVPELMRCLEHGSPKVRQAARSALLQILGRLPEPAARS